MSFWELLFNSRVIANLVWAILAIKMMELLPEFWKITNLIFEHLETDVKSTS